MITAPSTPPATSGKPSSLVASLAAAGLLTALSLLLCSPLLWLFERSIRNFDATSPESLGQALFLEPWRFLLYHFNSGFSFWLQVLPVALLICALLIGTVSVGLWQRRHWARPSFVALLWLSALGNFALLFAMKDQLRLLYLSLDITAKLNAGFIQLSAERNLIVLLPSIFLLLLATALTTAVATLVLHAWLAWRLGRADIRAEFASSTKPPAIG